MIKPEINGIKGNYYWLLDTGASGFVISPKAALTLGLEAFGELFAASIAGKVKAWQAPEALPQGNMESACCGIGNSCGLQSEAESWRHRGARVSGSSSHYHSVLGGILAHYTIWSCLADHALQVPARFIKAASWSLGPLTIRDPVMMTMDLEGLVKGGPGEVLGIVGFDLFR